MIADVRELRKLTRREGSALIEVAPFNRAVSKVKRNTEPSERKYRVETQA
jgi:hypothetical protein